MGQHNAINARDLTKLGYSCHVMEEKKEIELKWTKRLNMKLQIAIKSAVWRIGHVRLEQLDLFSHPLTSSVYAIFIHFKTF